ncbi:glycosyltransferase family 2 protein [bacterium]|nr:glycosyltransferase family 2 protein [bacterium]
MFFLKKMHPLLFMIFLNLITAYTTSCQPAKIVGIMRIKNEAQIIEQCLRALSIYTDAIVIIDDKSTDNTIEIIKTLAQECNIEKIIIKQGAWLLTESSDQNKLLQTGRKIGGTHFIFLDADEMFSSDCAKNNFLRNEILKLQPGDQIIMPLIELCNSTKTYRVDDGIIIKTFIFCDDKVSSYDSKFMHCFRAPSNLSGKKKTITTHCIMHFQGVNQKNMQIRQAWYRCLERIRMPNKSIEKINNCYTKLTDQTNLKLKPVQKKWFDGYDFFDPKSYEAPETWRKKMLYSWFDQYGRNYFSDINMILN